MTTPEAPLKVRTAFLVVQHENGEWQGVPNIDAPLIPERPATVAEMKFGCSEVVSDITASGVSAMVVQQFMAVTAQLNEQARTQAVREKLKV